MSERFTLLKLALKSCGKRILVVVSSAILGPTGVIHRGLTGLNSEVFIERVQRGDRVNHNRNLPVYFV